MIRKRPYLLIPVALWLAAVAFAAVFDLDISLSVAGTMNPFGRLFEIIGEIPAILFTSLNLSFIAVYFLRCKSNRLTSGISIILAVVLAYYTSNATLEYIESWRNDLSLGFIGDGAKLSIALIAALLFVSLFLYIAFKTDVEQLERILKPAVHCFIAAVLVFVVIWCLKLLWGRVRFRQLTDIAQFTPFYMPNGFSGFDGHYSFPSGHTANATVILSLTYYFGFIKSERIKSVLKCLLIIWIIIVALSRVVVGAHYLSDVLFGMAVTAVIVYLCRPKTQLL